MKLALTLLLIGTTLGTGHAAFAAEQGLSRPPRAVIYPVAESGAALTLIDADENEDDDEGGWLWPQSVEGDDDDDDCEDDDDDGCQAGAKGNPAKAGTVAPPKNGLFTNGTAPVVKSN
jgi:hypothetical protein